VLSSYIDDPKCKEVQEQLRINPASAPNFSLSNDIIRYKNRIVIGNNTELRKQLIESFHSSVLGGHSGERVTYIKSKHYFIGLV
jgi:hypothetical protein